MSHSTRTKPVFAAAFTCLVLSSALLFAPVASAQQHDPSMHDHAGMNMPPAPTDPAVLAKLRAKHLADKKESEFNHHLAGVFVILAGFFILTESFVQPRLPFLRFVWPLCFLGAGIFLLVFSDTELWPWGSRSWWWGLTQNREDLQHKTFAVLLLALAYIEIQRARGAFTAAWSAWIFPVLAFAGSGLLFFHEHHSGMGGGDHTAHMAIMQRIQSEHLSFSIAGFTIGLFKGFSEIRFRWQSLFARLWPIALIVLGVLLLLYVE